MTATSGTHITLAFQAGKPLDVVIVGGSSAGLMAGILLKRQGHHVRILEQAASSEREGLAAGIALNSHSKTFFDEHDRSPGIPFHVKCANLQFLDPKTLDVVKKWPFNSMMTSWDATYYRLKANFDGLKSGYCEQPPDLSSDAGTATFETGKRVVDIVRDGDNLTVTAQGVDALESLSYRADVAIVADGSNSSLREQFQPGVEREYPGYVIWRGTIPISRLSRELLDKVERDTSYYPMRYSYAIIYTIPGDNGRVGEGERVINLVWYTWPTSRQHLREILTDIEGKTHRTAVPKGKLRPEMWRQQVEIAKSVMHPLIAELPEKIEEPFVSVVSSFSSKQAKFLDDRVYFIGDALVTCQPNTGQGTALAAMDAMLLAKVFEAKMPPHEWERQVLETGRREQLRSQAFGNWFLCTWWGAGLSALRHQWCIWTQWWATLWPYNAVPAAKSNL